MSEHTKSLSDRTAERIQDLRSIIAALRARLAAVDEHAREIVVTGRVTTTALEYREAVCEHAVAITELCKP